MPTRPVDQPFLLQRSQRGAHGSARGTQLFSQLLLSQALAGREIAPQDAVAQLHQNGFLHAHAEHCTLDF